MFAVMQASRFECLLFDPFALFLYLVAWIIAVSIVSFENLSSCPGLHGDEAWFAMQGVSFMVDGVRGTNGMTWYSGALYPMLVSVVFKLFGVGIPELRGMAVIMFLGFLGFTTGFVWRRFGPVASVVLAGLFSQSLFFMWYGRVAWEVNSASWFIAALCACATTRIFDRCMAERALTKWDTFLLVTPFWLGCINHGMFLVFLTALVGASVLLWLIHRTEQVRLGATTMLPLLLLVLPLALKPLLEYAPALLVAGYFLSVPVLFSFFATSRATREMSQKLMRVIARGGGLVWENSAGKMVLICTFFCITVYAVLTHGLPLFEVLANHVVIQRMASGGSGALTIGAYQIAAAALTFVLGFLLFQLARGQLQDFPTGTSRLVALLALALLLYIDLLSFVVTRASIRYYAVPLFLAFMLISILLPYETVVRRRVVYSLIGMAAVLTLWVDHSNKETFGSRPPIYFSVGLYHIENSMHFIVTESLAHFMAVNRTCPSGLTADVPILRQMAFHFETRPWPCDPDRSAVANYCVTCQTSGYFIFDTQ